jgi:hypothetical protein
MRNLTLATLLIGLLAVPAFAQSTPAGGYKDPWANQTTQLPPAQPAPTPSPTPAPQLSEAPAPAVQTLAMAQPGTPSDYTQPMDGYEKNEVIRAASDFFGTTSEAVAQVVERVFSQYGKPVGYIAGDEGSAAFVFGLRYGEGTLTMKNGDKRKVYWQGPSVGFDTGGNAARVFTLVYGLQNPDGVYRRYPGVEGSAYFVGGIGVNYQKAEGVVLAPLRTGVGLRLGANVGYLAYSKKRRYNPF